MRWPWARPREISGTQNVTGDGGFVQSLPPTVDQAGFVMAACNLYGSTLAAATPAAGPLTGRLLYDCGYRLGRYGKWTAVIEIDGAGDVVLTPFSAWPRAGVWTGYTRECDGRDNRALTVPGAAVFHVELPSPPLAPLASTAAILQELERAMAQEAIMPVLKYVKMGSAPVSIRPEQLDELSRGLAERYNDGGFAVLPAYAEEGGSVQPDPSEGALALRTQMRTDVEALFGVVGLLSEGDGASAQAHWRVAMVRTFGPLANMIEAEAAAKLAGPVTLNRNTWFAAAHGDRARLIVARANGIARLVNAGMSIDDARTAVAGFDDD